MTNIEAFQLPEPLSAKYTKSFAYVTIKDRLPIILTKVIDGLARNKNDVYETHGPEGKAELKEIINRLSKLKNEITTDKPLCDIVDEREDVSLWNKAINEEAESTPSWFTSPWLLVECFMYRRIQESFDLSKHLKYYDPFAEQKQRAFHNSIAAIEILNNYLTEVNNYQLSGDEKLKKYFSQFLQFALWGNKCDLSISVGNDSSQISNPLTQLNDLQSFILVNNVDLIWNSLRDKDIMPDSTNIRVDFIMDNAGFELFTDLCFADFLIFRGLAHRIYFHVKEMPWFVSDVTKNDFAWTIETAKSDPKLSERATRWEKFLADGTWNVKSHYFWTLPHDFSLMRAIFPQLYSDLSEAQLLIFKGDLNYRKLTGDLDWPHTTAFETSLRGFGPAALCSLRTLKADVVVGLPAGLAEKTAEQHENWMISGDYAVIEFANQRR